MKTEQIDSEANGESHLEKTESIFIYIRNNGNPFPPGFDTSFFVTDGKTTQGTGYGGALINQIIKAHNGTLSVIPSEAIELSSFKVQFKIELPIIQ